MEPDIGIVETPFANVVIRSFGATPWRFGAADYVAAGGAASGQALTGASVAASWDAALAIPEEGVAAALLVNLEE